MWEAIICLIPSASDQYVLGWPIETPYPSQAFRDNVSTTIICHPPLELGGSGELYERMTCTVKMVSNKCTETSAHITTATVTKELRTIRISQ